MNLKSLNPYGHSTPCFGCEKRYAGCHADCGEYAAFRSKLIRMKHCRKNEAEKRAYTDAGTKRSYVL